MSRRFPCPECDADRIPRVPAGGSDDGRRWSSHLRPGPSLLLVLLVAAAVIALVLAIVCECRRM